MQPLKLLHNNPNARTLFGGFLDPNRTRETFEVLVTRFLNPQEGFFRRERAWLELVELKDDEKVIPAMIAALDSEIPEVRIRALDMLGSIRTAISLEPVVKKLDDGEEAVRLQAVSTLWSILSVIEVESPQSFGLVSNAFVISPDKKKEAVDIAYTALTSKLLSRDTFAVKDDSIRALMHLGVNHPSQERKEQILASLDNFSKTKKEDSSLRRTAEEAIKTITEGYPPEFDVFGFSIY